MKRERASENRHLGSENVQQSSVVDVLALRLGQFTNIFINIIFTYVSIY